MDVTVVEAAAWIFDGQAALDADNLSGSRLARVADESSDNDGGDLFVPTVDLRRFLDRPITLLKVDIEGGESTLLRHCALELAIHVSYVHVEVHELRPSPRALIPVLTTLEQAGFEYHVSPLHVDPQPFRSRLSYREIVNPLAVYAWKPPLRPVETPVDVGAAPRSSEM